MEEKIEINDEHFWEWMNDFINPANNNENPDSIKKYIEKITKNEIDPSYIIELLSQRKCDNHSNIMERLHNYMPYEYFLEIQYCALVYSMIIGKIFPPLMPSVEQLAYIEWLLYTEPEKIDKNRDHIVHMFKVAFVGTKLLSDDNLLYKDSFLSKIVKWQFDSSHFKEWCNENNFIIIDYSEDDKKDIIKMAFFLSAIFHDFGYGYKFLRDYKDKLFKLFDWLQPELTCINESKEEQMLFKSLPAFFVKTHHSDIDLENLNIKMDKIKIATFFRDCLGLNHSISSCLFILDITENLFNSRALNRKLYIAFHLAAEASMIHDLTREKNRPGKDDMWMYLKNKDSHFLDNSSHKEVPLAILLILCDELSVWNRPLMKPEKIDNNSVCLKLDSKDETRIIKNIKILIKESPKEIELTIDKDNDKDTKKLKEDLDKLKFFKNGDKKLEFFGYIVKY